jgi:hypothetical protein
LLEASVAKCPICDGAEWVCETYPGRPWGDCTNPRNYECGAGAPCPRCNPLYGDHDPKPRSNAPKTARLGGVRRRTLSDSALDEMGRRIAREKSRKAPPEE